MLPLNGHWIFICQKTEFHLKDGVCFCVYRRGGFFPNHAALGWRVIGIIGPQHRRDPIQIGDSLILSKDGAVFYTPAIDAIKRARKKRMSKPRNIPEFLPEELH